jgi:hypothetical protein
VTQAAFLKLAERLTLINAAAVCGALLILTFLTEGLLVPPHGVVGGDFLAFYMAGDFALRGDALTAYDFEAFDEALQARAPSEHLGMMWQYPPTVFFLVAPFALLPYKLSFILWCAIGAGVLALALSHLGVKRRDLRLLILSPLCLGVIDNGQISMLTAALLFIAAYNPKEKWLIAGIAAGLLTIKPQLGILLPVAFVVIGAWRTILTAAATAAILHLPSIVVYGVESWRSFLLAVARLNSDVTGAGLNTPPNGMTTLFGQLRMVGASSDVAIPLQYAFTAAVALLVAYCWRKSADPLAKAALLCAGAILATPYAYGYEMTALLLPALFIAREAVSYRTPQGLYLIGCWIVLATGALLPSLFGLQFPFLISASAFALVLAQILHPQRQKTLHRAVPV